MTAESTIEPSPDVTGAVEGPEGTGRRIGRWLIALLLLVIAGAGIGSVLADLDMADDAMKKLALGTEAVYGVASLGSAIALLFGFAWLSRCLALFVVAISLTSGLAAIGWGGASVWTGILAALFTLPIVALIAWGALRLAVREGTE